MTLDEARAAEAALRGRLAAAVTERARATKEAERLRSRADLPGADHRVEEAAETQARLASAAQAEIDRLRASLREAEGRVVALEAEADASPVDGG